MNIDKVLKSLPVTRVNRVQGHPEPYHLRVLFHMADRCGTRPLLVEYGVTNGSVALVLRAGAHPEADVVLVGPYPEHLQPWIDRGVIRHLDKLADLESSPQLIWIGTPAAAADIEAVLELNPRVICVYDIHAESVYQLKGFEPNARAAIMLKKAEGRNWSELSRTVGIQNTRRGLLISEALRWSHHPPAPRPKEVTPAALPEPAEVPAAAEPSRPRAVYQKRTTQNDLAKEEPAP